LSGVGPNLRSGVRSTIALCMASADNATRRESSVSRLIRGQIELTECCVSQLLGKDLVSDSNAPIADVKTPLFGKGTGWRARTDVSMFRHLTRTSRPPGGNERTDYVGTIYAIECLFRSVFPNGSRLEAAALVTSNQCPEAMRLWQSARPEPVRSADIRLKN